MPITDLPQSDIFAPLGSERPFAATPGQMDVDHGSDSPVEKPSWWSLTSAAFRNDNTVGSYSASETRNSPTYQEEGFHPWESIKGTKYEAHPKRFADVRNTRASDDLKRQIDREEQDQKTLDAVPWYQSLPLHLVAGGLDLPSLIPGGAFVRSAQGGISIGRTALNVSLAAGVSSLAQETALQQSQATRQLSESATNIGASVFLGGLLGAGGAKLLSRGEWNAAVRTVETGHGGAAGQVYDDVLGQLKATGMGDAEAQANASVVAARYATRAERLGAENAFDLYKNEGISVRGVPDATSVPGQSFEQRAASMAVPAEAAGSESRVSTRLPTAARATEDALGAERLTIGLDAMKRDQGLYEHNINLLRDYPNITQAQQRGSADEVARSFIDHVKDNLRYLYSIVPADVAKRSSLWYEGGNKIVQDFASQYKVHPNSAAAAVAALSPQKDWFQNVDLARRVLDIHTTKSNVRFTPEMAATAPRVFGDPKFAKGLARIEGHTYGELTDPIEKAMWLRLYDEAHHDRSHRLVTPEGNFGDVVRTKAGAPSGTGWGSLVEIAKAIQGLEAKGDIKSITPLLGERHKVRNFYNNLIAPNSHAGDVTIDTHAVAAALLRPLSGNSLEVAHNFGNYAGAGKPNTRSSSVTGVQGAYGIYADAYRELANELGILPRQLQSITWEAVRGLFVDTWKSQAKNVKAVDDIWLKYKHGKIGADEARRETIEAAGGVRPPDWYQNGPLAAHDAARRDSVDARELSANGIPYRDTGPVDGGVGGGVAADAPGWKSPLVDVNERTLFQNPKGWETAEPGGALGHPQGNITLGENKAIIRLFSTADRSTFMHEAGHLWLSELVRDARKNAGIKSDLDAVLKWFGVDDASKISRSHNEQWARGFEEYLRDGNAPSSALAKAFEAFKNWLTKIYGSIAQIHSDHVPISNEVRGVMDRMLATDTELAGRNAAGGPGLSSAGAAANLPRSIEENTIAGKAAQSLAAATGQLNPIMRALRSPSAAWREISQQLFETPLYLKKNFENVASDVAAETLMKEWNGGLAKAIIATKDAFEAYKKAGGEMARDEFRQAVGKAMRRGDASDDPHVAQVAKEWRAKVFDPLKDAAIKAGLLPEDVDVKTAASYFSRMWNRNKLIAREGEFKQIVRDWVQGQYQTWEKSFEAETRNKSAALEAEKRAAFEAERAAKQETLFENPKESAHDIANQVFNTLTGKTGDPSVRPEFITIKARGPLKERTFNIPDQLVEDFLEHDVEMVGRRYTRIIGADVELANKFDGSPDMADQIAKIHEDYAQLRNGITDEKQLTKLGNREKADIRDLEAVRDLLRGTGTFYNRAVEGNFNRIVNGANQFNYTRQMGEVVLASLTDVIRPAMVHGLMPYMGGLVQLATNMKGVKLSVAEAKLAGNVLERTLAHRMATIAEIIDPYSAKTPVEAMLRNLTEVGSKWNGIRLWTDGMKSFSSVLTQNRILKGVESFAGLKDKEKAYLAFLGIDESMAGRVAKEFTEHGETVEGVRVANTEKWDDPVVRRAYRAAINKDVDSIIVQKGVADTPLMANTPMGRAVLQFKSFSLASHQRILMRGLQEDQARLVGGIVAMTTMGMMMTWLKAVSGNRVEKLEDISKNPGWWIAEGLDRSGVLSVPVEAANAFEKLTHFNPIKTPMKAFDEGSAISQKLQNRNELGAALGPSFGMLQDIGTAVGIPKTMAQGEEVSKGQERAVSRLLPFRTYMGVRQLMDYVVTPPQ